MPPDRPSVAELDALSERWSQRLDDELAHASFSADELSSLAARLRALARVTDSAGQRRAMLATAASFESAALARVAGAS